MSQYVWGRGFEPDPRGIGRNGYTMDNWQQDYNNFYSQPPDTHIGHSNRPTGPWNLWNAFPEERTGIGTSYINRQIESGQSLADIKQNAADNNWVIGPDAWNKFYNTSQDTGYQQNKMGVWSTGTSGSEAFANSMDNYRRDPLNQFNSAMDRWRTRTQLQQQNEATVRGFQGASMANQPQQPETYSPTGGAQNILKIAKPRKTQPTQDVFSNQVTL